jgi:hypothetical protein
VIVDTDGNVFEGFTPVEWESRRWNGQRAGSDSRCKGDGSPRSFLFTLRNPRNIAARTFPLRAQRTGEAVICDSDRGPHFWEIGIRDNCNANRDSFADVFGYAYENDTGLPGGTFCTGAPSFTVKEKEVFEITD